MSHQLLRIAVLTDLHAFAGKSGDGAPSWLALGEDQGNARSNPFASLSSLVERENLTADIVMCCGDMGDKASPEGQQYVWREVGALKEQLGASEALGTAGNHDLDSRFQHTSFDAKGQIQALSPPFPVSERSAWLEYWAQNYTILEHLGARIVLLNSAAYHGYAKNPSSPEYEHGRVSDRTLEALMKDLKERGEYAANVLVCHHHPFKNDVIKIPDYSQMENGDRLINELSTSLTGPWLIIHGHKHMPRVFYAPGGNSAPAIFSAGSFSARLYPEYMDLARNEFYILDLQIPLQPGLETSVKGIINTWQWSFGNGWVKPTAGKGLGPSAAFGTRAEVGAVAAELAQSLMAGYSGKSVSWDDVIRLNPRVRYLIPEDLKQLLHILNSSYQIRPVAEYETGEVAEVQVPQ